MAVAQERSAHIVWAEAGTFPCSCRHNTAWNRQVGTFWKSANLYQGCNLSKRALLWHQSVAVLAQNGAER